MKKFVLVLFLSFIAVNQICAQPSEKLTNSTILKMVKAKLSDDLIIGEINSSEVRFELSADSVNYLKKENVSSYVIQAMTVANERQTSSVAMESKSKIIPVEPEKPAVPAKQTLIQPVVIQVKDSTSNPKIKQSAVQTSIPIEKPKSELKTTEPVNLSDKESTITVNAMSYIIPVTDLISFFDTEFTSLAGIIQGWNQQIRNSIESVRQLKANIKEVDVRLMNKKNANTKGFDNEIVILNNQLTDYRLKYKLAKEGMLADGMNITKKLKEMSNELDRSIGTKFSNVGDIVRSTNPDPSSEIAKPITITKQKIDTELINYISPVTEMLFFCQNENIVIKNIIVTWNEDVIAINKKDAELIKHLEPLKKELTNYQLNPKKNKKEISSLKKQCSELEKERKGLAQEMGKDSKELSKYLDVICKDVQGSVKERYADIINNINYLYQDNLTGF